MGLLEFSLGLLNLENGLFLGNFVFHWLRVGVKVHLAILYHRIVREATQILSGQILFFEHLLF